MRNSASSGFLIASNKQHRFAKRTSFNTLASYLITGGAGFIGSHLAHALVERGETVRILDNFETGLEKNLAAIRDSIDLRNASLTDP
ncbi:MAG: GDP-mannose 4,6-dehydratase, partial [Acidobacteria bacterium]|nr:GDP-mannose 4,6-dehydratase [Acidobacteriota bacterium]